MILPTTGEHCFVQVKSQTNRTTFRNLVDALDNSQGYDEQSFRKHLCDVAAVEGLSAITINAHVPSAK